MLMATALVRRIGGLWTGLVQARTELCAFGAAAAEASYGTAHGEPMAEGVAAW